MSKSKGHAGPHKYYKNQLSPGIKVWACSLAACNHFMPKHLENLIPGRLSLCFSCGEQIVLDPIRIKMDKPLCDDCLSGINPRSSVVVKDDDDSTVSNDPIEERLRQLL